MWVRMWVGTLTCFHHLGRNVLLNRTLGRLQQGHHRLGMFELHFLQHFAVLGLFVVQGRLDSGVGVGCEFRVDLVVFDFGLDQSVKGLGCAERSEIVPIFNQVRATCAEPKAKRIEWVSLVVDVAVCSHFARSIASILVFLKARSLRSLT